MASLEETPVVEQSSLQDGAKKLISEAKNICLIPSQTNEPESLAATLALFYTLRQLGKNVNLIVQDVPEKLAFLIPPLDFISQPKNFVISIPRNIADVSQVYYEKNEDNLKIHLTINSGNIKKDNISFYFTNTKPDATITLGIQNFQRELEARLDSFGFILDSPIINIDSITSPAINNGQENTKFGKINIIKEKSLSQITLDIIQSLGENLVDKNTANCLLTGLTLHYENFQNPKTAPEIFELCAYLMKQGADRQQITTNLYRAEKQEVNFNSQEVAKSL